MRALLLAATLLATVPAFAQAPPQRIRGTIASVTGNDMVIHPNDGADVTVQLASDTALRADTPSSLGAIKPGSTLAIVSRGPADKQQAVALRVMAPGITIRMGVSAWDMLPESTMTNAVVEGQSEQVSGQTMQLKAGDKTVQMAFPPTAVIALESAGDRAMLVPGAKVAVFAAPGDGGPLSARAVIVGLQGMTPPV